MGTSRKIKLAILTSSRADFGIYLPLLNQLKKESAFFDFSIIAFGTHLSPFHGHTIDEIYNSGFETKFRISSILLSDNEESIATSYALTVMKFANFWAEQKKSFDCVLCLGDRFEMAAAVTAGIPFNIFFAHIHGGETTLGAIDNIYRHTISLASKIHFVAAAAFAEKIKSFMSEDAICNIVGALSLDNINNHKLPSKEVFTQRWGISNDPFILFTFHPETVEADKILLHLQVIESLINKLTGLYNLVITMPNTDTNGSMFRNLFNKLSKNYLSKIILIENFGTENYFSAMQYAAIIVGNSSSGIIEAASFGKYVINIGDRQRGRLASENVINCKLESEIIFANTQIYFDKKFSGQNVFKIGNAAELISEVLKNSFD